MSQASTLNPPPDSGDRRLKAVLRAQTWVWLAYANSRPLQPLCISEEAASKLADFVEVMERDASNNFEPVQPHGYFIPKLDIDQTRSLPNHNIFRSRDNDIILMTLEGEVCPRVFDSLDYAVLYAARWRPSSASSLTNTEPDGSHDGALLPSGRK